MTIIEKQGYSDIEDNCRRLYPDLIRAFGDKMYVDLFSKGLERLLNAYEIK